MLLNVCAILMILKVGWTLNDGQDWDLAVATDGHIELLLANGSILGTVREGFTRLKALTFDGVRHQFIASDMDEQKDTIYAIDLTKETENDPIIADLPDDVQGLAIDPIDDILYWTDPVNHTINYMPFKDQQRRSHILFTFQEAAPQDIAVDACRRYLYWTNSFIRNPTIERAKLGSQTAEIIVNDDLGIPAGITIDYITRRIYWADMRSGIYYRIESANLEGKEREIVYEGIHATPFAVAVKNEYLYFTDLRRNSLWKFDLAKTSQPSEIKSFETKPMGLIAKKEQIKTLPDCKILEEAYKNYTESTIEIYEKYQTHTRNKTIECINGTLQDGVCKCDRGFGGAFCEIAMCHNYCVFGTCHLTDQGFPFCHCPKGFGGSRCEKDCDGYCLNGGECSFSHPYARFPTCKCPTGFRGPKCEENIVMDRLCNVYCMDEANAEKKNEKENDYCRCDRRSYLVGSQSPQALLSDASQTKVNYFQDPVFIAMSGVSLFALTVCFILTICIFYLRKKPSPRIRRRYIVNKATSLTERPQHPDQCEITIENCCNMNVCETPCFEPSKLQSYQHSKSDDKKMLLPNMERTEDLY